MLVNSAHTHHTQHLYSRRSASAWKSEYRLVTSERKWSDLTVYCTVLYCAVLYCTVLDGVLHVAEDDPLLLRHGLHRHGVQLEAGPGAAEAARHLASQCNSV